MDKQNNKQIFFSIYDCFEKSRLKEDEKIEISLQFLAWVKLPTMDLINPLEDSLSFVHFYRQKDFTLENLIKTFQQLSGSISFLLANYIYQDNTYLFSSNISRCDKNSLLNVFTKLDDFIRNDLIKNFSIPEDLFTDFKETFCFQNEVNNLIFEIIGDIKDKEVYCPYDNYCQFINKAFNSGATVLTESISTKIPHFINFFSQGNIQVGKGDLIKVPSFSQGSKFCDITIAFPPLGSKNIKIEKFEDSYFNKYPFPKEFVKMPSSPLVLAIDYILKHTKEKAIIIVPNQFLYSQGIDEKSLKQYLINQKMIEAIIDLPSNIIPLTSLKFSILVCNLKHKFKNVRFIDGANEQFISMGYQRRPILQGWKQIVELMNQDQEQEELFISIPYEEVLKNKELYLNPSYYIQSSELKKAEKFLQETETCVLKDLVEIISYRFLKHDEEGIDVFRVTSLDSYDFGYMPEPLDKFKIEEKIAKESQLFLQPNDIIFQFLGNVGKVAIVPNNAPPPGENGWIASRSWVILRIRKTTGIDPKFLFMYLSSQLAQLLIERITFKGTTATTLQLKALENLKIPLPSNAEEMKKVVDNFDQIVKHYSEIDKIKEKINTLVHLNWSNPFN